MGFFSTLAARVDDDYDHSYPSAEQRLLWRLEELTDRLHSLITEKTAERDDGVCFSDDNLRYVLPEHFLSVSDVKKAILLATRELAECYGIYVHSSPIPSPGSLPTETDREQSVA